MTRWFLAAAAAASAAGPVGQADSSVSGIPAAVTVTAPVGATLTIDGHKTQQMTAVRQFVSPPLPTGRTFVYTFQATYTWDGRPVARQKRVDVAAGSRVTVDMFAADRIAASPPAPAPIQWTKPAADDAREASGNAPQAAGQKPPPKVEKPEIEVPFVPTPEKVVAEMLKTATVKSGEVVYDLGCGDGRIVIAAVKDFGAKKGLGIDFNPVRVKDSQENAKKAGAEVVKKLEFKQGDVLKMTPKDFEGVDVVTLYLFPEVNRRLKPVLQKGLKPGARIVSHDFDMGDDWKPEKTINVVDDDGVDHTVYLWTIREKK